MVALRRYTLKKLPEYEACELSWVQRPWEQWVSKIRKGEKEGGFGTIDRQSRSGVWFPANHEKDPKRGSWLQLVNFIITRIWWWSVDLEWFMSNEQWSLSRDLSKVFFIRYLSVKTEAFLGVYFHLLCRIEGTIGTDVLLTYFIKPFATGFFSFNC